MSVPVVRMHLPEQGPASWGSLHAYVTTVLHQRTAVTGDTTADRLARLILLSVLSRLGIDPHGAPDDRAAKDFPPVVDAPGLGPVCFGCEAPVQVTASGRSVLHTASCPGGAAGKRVDVD